MGDSDDDDEKAPEGGGIEEYRVLFMAAQYGRADIIGSAAQSLKAKLEEGADLATALGVARNEENKSLLEVACDKDKIDAIRALLRVGP